MGEGGSGKSASGIWDTRSLDLLGQEAGYSVVMGGLTAYLRCMREVYGLRGRGEAPGDVVETCGSREADDGHFIIYLGDAKETVVTGILQAWQGQGRGGGGGVTDSGGRGRGTVVLVCWDGDR